VILSFLLWQIERVNMGERMWSFIILH